jgi:type IV secretory pathway component VirB8
MTLDKKIQNIGITLSNSMTGAIVMSNIVQPLNEIIPKLKSCYITYNEGCILTSLIPSKYVKEFSTFITNLQHMLQTANEVIQQPEPNYLEISKYDIPQLYGNNYSTFVNHLCEPFKDKKLNTITRMKSLPPNYFVDDNTKHFTRPVSPYCFMVLRYDNDED